MFPRPPPQYRSFDHLDVLPELAGMRLLEIAATNTAVKLWCRACGREVVLPARCLRDLACGHHTMTIEQLVRAARCETCGARETQASGWDLGPHDSDRAPTVRHAFHGGPFCPHRQPRGS